MLSLSVDSQPTRGSYVSLFHGDFVLVALIFATFLGVIVVILEGSKKRTSNEIFMAALGFPAVLSGVLNTASATNKLEKVEQAKVVSEKTLTDLLGIPQSTANTMTILSGANAHTTTGSNSSQSRTPFSIFPQAFAQASAVAQEQSKGFDPGIRLDRPSYVVVIKAAGNEADAKKAAESLRATIPTVQAVKTDKGVYVIDSASPRSQADAVRDAVRLRENKTLTPSLLQIPSK